MTTPALAQNPAMQPEPPTSWPGVEIVEGVAFQGDGSVTVEGSEAGVPVVAFWRPVLFKENTKRPVAGRMDCRLAASEHTFSEALFDLNARHKVVEDRREDQGLIQEDRRKQYSEHARQLDIIGRRNAPHEHFVLSYIAVRNGDRLVDIRRNCIFIHGEGAGRPDWLSYIARYTALRFAFEPNAPDTDPAA